MKKKLTLAISEEVIEKSKRKASEMGLSLSRIVENALRFFADPEVYCFSCGFKFRIKEAEMCPKCGWYICPKCGACGCRLGEEGAKVAFYMRKTLMEIFNQA
ncbi:MAG: DUF6364 family protein [Candidatus Njordarchaeales archaeon]